MRPSAPTPTFRFSVARRSSYRRRSRERAVGLALPARAARTRRGATRPERAADEALGHAVDDLLRRAARMSSCRRFASHFPCRSRPRAACESGRAPCRAARARSAAPASPTSSARMRATVVDDRGIRGRMREQLDEVVRRERRALAAPIRTLKQSATNCWRKSRSRTTPAPTSTGATVAPLERLGEQRRPRRRRRRRARSRASLLGVDSQRAASDGADRARRPAAFYLAPDTRSVGRFRGFTRGSLQKLVPDGGRPSKVLVAR